MSTDIVSTVILGLVVLAMIALALRSVIRSIRSGSACGCVSGRSCDGDCARCDCTDCKTADRKKLSSTREQSRKEI